MSMLFFDRGMVRHAMLERGMEIAGSDCHHQAGKTGIF